MSNSREWRENFAQNYGSTYENQISEALRNSGLTSDFLQVYLYELTGFIFSINERWNGNVHFHLLTREKSQESMSKKTKRFEKQVKEGTRLDSSIHDYIASSFIIDRVDESDDLAQYSSDEVIKRYSERKQDIDLLGNLIKFFNRQVQIGDFYSEYDKPETLQASINALSISFNTDFADNILRYRENVDISKIKPTQLDQRVLSVLRSKRAETISLEKELEQRGSIERKEKLKEKIEYYDRAIEIIRANISKQKSKKDEDKEDEQENYYKYLIILLDRIQSLEYTDCKESYEEVSQELNRTIQTFIHKMVNEEQSFNDNVTLENLVVLEKWCKKLNAQMSDKLQQEIIRDSMNDNGFINLPGLKTYIETDELLGTPRIQSHIKSNGYVSDHYNLVTRLDLSTTSRFVHTELKGMTHYRDKVARDGNASYGNSREDHSIREEKKRPLSLLPTTILDTTFNSDKSPLNKVRTIQGFGTIQELKNDSNQLEKWRDEIDKITPKYINSRYDPETQKVTHTIYSTLKNVEIYFGETNIRKQRQKVREGIAIIREEGFLPYKNIEISMSLEEYLEYMQNGELTRMIENVIQSLNTETIQDCQSIEEEPENI